MRPKKCHAAIKRRVPKPPSKECPLQKLFGISDGGDILLLLLIVFFLTDGDSENDKLIPLLLAVLLLL